MSLYSAAWNRPTGGGGGLTTLDDFEHNDLVGTYSGDTGNFSIQSTDAYEGTYALEYTGPDYTYSAITRTDVTVAQGDTVSVQMNNVGGNSESMALVMVQGETGYANLSGYGIGFNPESDSGLYAKHVTYTNGSTSTSNSGLLSVDLTDWIELEVEITSGGQFNYQFHNPDGTEAATWSTTDTTYTSGGIGATSWNTSPRWDLVQSTGEAAPTTAYIDDFEDGNLLEYGSDGAISPKYTVEDGSNWTVSPYSGSQMLVMNRGSGTQRLYSFPGDGLPNYLPMGGEVTFWFAFEDGGSWDSGDTLRMLFGYNDTGNYNDIVFNFLDGYWEIHHLSQDNSQSYAEIASSNFTFTDGTWYACRLLRADGSRSGYSSGDIEAELLSADLQTSHGLVSTSSPYNQSSDAIGWRGYGNNEGAYFLDSALRSDL